MPVYTTEIASDKILSDNPIHQRLLKPYLIVNDFIKGKVLEVGCGQGRGVEMLVEKSDEFTALDKIEAVIEDLQKTYPTGKFIAGNIPPFTGLEDNSFDFIVSFQVIEHIKNDELFLKEIHRVLKPGGKAILTTPNKTKTLTRNPWHIREYTPNELTNLAKPLFQKVEMKGITGNEKIWEYYNRNKESVKKFTKWDILNLQYRLPNWMLRIPYDVMNRLNRNSLQDEADELVTSISHNDYLLTENAEEALDLFLIVTK